VAKFLVVRYPPGGAGKMLCALLGFHPDIQSWNNTEQSDSEWFKSSFTSDFDSWLDNEPKNCYSINQYYSATYTRGDDLSNLPINFADLWIPLHTHKFNIPNWMQHYQIITIMLDQPSLKWFYKSKWRKRYSARKIDDGYEITQQEHRDSYKIAGFESQNLYKVKTNSLYRFIRNNIIEDNFTHLFKNPPVGKNDIVIPLSELLEYKSIIDNLQKIANTLQIIPYENLENIYNHWRNLHDY
jgi:hypothetical protein